jgi:short-subunit dehydrogenase
MSGIIPMPAGAGVYVASKYAVTGLSEMLRAELAEEGIGVSLLCPGGVRTRIMEAERNRPENLGPALPGLTLPDEALAAMMDPMDVAARVLAAIRANEFYVFSHPELLDSVDAHYDRLVKNARLAAGI